MTKTIPFVYIPLRINQRRETNADRVRPSGGQYPRDPSRRWGERRRNKIYGEKLETAAERRATTNGEARVGGRLTHTTDHHLELGQKKLQRAPLGDAFWPPPPPLLETIIFNCAPPILPTHAASILLYSLYVCLTYSLQASLRR